MNRVESEVKSQSRLLVYGLPFFIFYTFVADKLFSVINVYRIPGTDYVLAWVFTTVVLLACIKTMRLDRRYLILLMLMMFYLCLNYIWGKMDFAKFLLGFLFTFMYAFKFLIYNSFDVGFDDIKKIFEVLYGGMCFCVLILFGIWSVKWGVDIKSHALTPFQGVGVTGMALCTASALGFSLFFMTCKIRYLIINFVFFAILAFLAIKKSFFVCSLFWIIFLFLAFNGKKRIKIFIVATFVFCMICILFGNGIKNGFKTYSDQYSKYGSDGVVRLKVLATGVEIAKDYFPLGSGLGTYCSMPSLQMPYSDVYFDYGFHKDWALSPYCMERNGRLFLLDTYWAHIIGELGFVGGGLFLIMWFYPVLKTLHGIWDVSRIVKSFAFFILCVNLSMTIEGFAIYASENVSFIMVNGALVGLACKVFCVVKNCNTRIEGQYPKFRVNSVHSCFKIANGMNV